MVAASSACKLLPAEVLAVRHQHLRGLVRTSRLAVCVVVLTSCRGSEMSPDAFAEVAELERQEMLRIGGLSERAEHVLSGVRDAALFARGRLAIADGASQQIRIFDLHGSHVRSLGGEGNGPGEFRAIRRLSVLPHDELLAWDIQRRRVTIFDTAGVVVRSSVVDIGPLDALAPSFVGAFSDGVVAVRADLNPMGLKEEPEGVRRDSISIGLFDVTGALLGVPLRFSGPERDFFNSDGYWGFEEPLFARHLVHAVVGEALFVGHTDSIYLRRFVDGRETSALHVQRPSRRASSGEVRSERQRQVGELARRAEVTRDLLVVPDIQRELANYELARLDKVRALESMPAFADLLGSDDGHLWLKDRLDYAAATVAWYRLDEDGTPIGRFTLPLSETLLSITDRYAATLVKDELDVESVIVYEFGGLSER